MSDTLENLKRRYPDAATFTFGDGPDLCKKLLSLVRSGQKVATTGALRDFDAGEPLPVVGRRDIALHWDGSPACVIETQKVVTCRFSDVTEPMALAEGENPNRAGWAADHRAYFERNGGFTEDMMVVWERFRVITMID